ncbi:LysR family transcriptional regulator [Chromobacterium haemolyticum]|uniref:LysR family transcriptional regulator n=1 Tax=Chromobacterium fluminis TaxID=3044269 RepID=A0ABX0KZA2_9NEIS|nr:LysR substrate-binding domain-containing protein [Chromobacterium haemolyticum]NHR03983.1 LysR family transcriptional regulator [Chromobacterium haemolyticum]
MTKAASGCRRRGQERGSAAQADPAEVELQQPGAEQGAAQAGEQKLPRGVREGHEAEPTVFTIGEAGGVGSGAGQGNSAGHAGQTLSAVLVSSVAYLCGFGLLLLDLAEAPLEIRCNTDHSPQIMQNLLSGLVQMGFVLRCPAMAGIQMETLWRSPIVAVAAAGHPLAEREQPRYLEEAAAYRIAPQYWGVECDELIRRLRLARTVAQPIHAVQPASAARELALRHGFLCFMPELSI